MMRIDRTIKYEGDRVRGFGKEIMSVSGCGQLQSCIQCGTCSGTCPLSIYMDFSPRQVMALVRADFKNEVLRSHTVWLCASCYACTSECPRQIRITDIMYALKQRAIQEGIYPKRFPIPVLAKEFSEDGPQPGADHGDAAGDEAFLQDRLDGRSEFVAAGHWDDADRAVFIAIRTHRTPRRTGRDAGRLRQWRRQREGGGMKYSYFPGCSLKGLGRSYEESLLPVMKHLSVELTELNDWNCCGATAYMSVDEGKAAVLAARNLAIAEKAGPEDLMTPCSACYLALNKTQHNIADFPEN